MNPTKLKHSCGCTLPRFDLYAPFAQCLAHGNGQEIRADVDWTHFICKSVSAPVGGAPDLHEGPRPSDRWNSRKGSEADRGPR